MRLNKIHYLAEKVSFRVRVIVDNLGNAHSVARFIGLININIIPFYSKYNLLLNNNN